jgi:hypothetical protein
MCDLTNPHAIGIAFASPCSNRTGRVTPSSRQQIWNSSNIGPCVIGSAVRVRRCRLSQLQTRRAKNTVSPANQTEVSAIAT